MAAFMKFEGIKGEATDSDHEDWIIIQNMNSSVIRSIPEGAKDSQRSRGDTTLGSIEVVRELDKSSVKLVEACANGTFFESVEIHFCTQVGNAQEPYLKYVLFDVIVDGFCMDANASGDPLPMENISLGYTEVEWTYVTVDPKNGNRVGIVPGSFNPGKGKAG